MNNLIKSIFIILISIALFNGCVVKNVQYENISEKRALIPKLTGKVKAGILEGLRTQEELKSFINEEFPQTIQKFEDYAVFMKNDNGTAVVLICSKDETKALIEDASCYGFIEGSELFKKELPCTFQLDIQEVCK
jgi:hypothetical protein